MDLGIIVVWLSLIVYTVVVIETKIVNKKERKLVFILVTVTAACSFLVMFHISLHSVVTFLNSTFGRLSRMVVKI